MPTSRTPRPSSSSLIGSKHDAAPTVVFVDANPFQRGRNEADLRRVGYDTITRAAPGSGKRMKRMHVGSRVRIADRAILHTALHSPPEHRPEPAQMAWAGRKASVTGYRRGSEDRSLYALKGAPGLWLEEWIEPI